MATYFIVRDREGRRAYVYANGIVLTRDGIPSWPWSAYGVDGIGAYAGATGDTRDGLLSLLGMEG